VAAGDNFEIVIIGAGLAGIATAHYLCSDYGISSVLLIDREQPMSYTSAQSGDNYRNWWPHPTMTAFTNDSIDLMEQLARDSDDVFNMRRTGYALATREEDIDGVLAALESGTDIDVISGRQSIHKLFPALSDDIQNVIHIRRAGDISGQQLGQYMLERINDAGAKRLAGDVTGITRISSRKRFDVVVESAQGETIVAARKIVNAAGPFAQHIATMLGVELPIKNIFQQKIAFEDVRGAIPRDMPFTIDMDAKSLGWTDEERELLRDDPEHRHLADVMPAGTHCRPEGGRHGNWVKLGWAYNTAISEPQRELANEPCKDPQFPEIGIRGAAAMIPALATYVESAPSRFSHYGGYYTITDENWPLIGSMACDGAFMVTALSGFGSMAACAAGKLCAATICGDKLPPYAGNLSLERFNDAGLMVELTANSNKGLL